MLVAGIPFEPELFLEYQQEESQDKSLFFESGIIARSPQIDAEFAKGGRTIEIPHFGDLTGADEILDDTSGLTLAGIKSLC